MKIKITQSVPVEPKIRPIINGIYDVVRTETQGRRTIYFIVSDDTEVGVFNSECEVVKE